MIPAVIKMAIDQFQPWISMTYLPIYCPVIFPKFIAAFQRPIKHPL